MQHSNYMYATIKNGLILQQTGTICTWSPMMVLALDNE